jgi:hypothetical protein
MPGSRHRVRITISHNRSKAEVMKTVDQSLDELFRPMGGIPLQFVVQQRSWQGSTLNFAFTAKMAFLSTPIQGMVEVTDRDLTIDVDLGGLGRLIPAKTFQETLGNRVRGLLK